MKISKLIRQLQTLRDALGDVEIQLYSDFKEDPEPIGGVVPDTDVAFICSTESMNHFGE